MVPRWLQWIGSRCPSPNPTGAFMTTTPAASPAPHPAQPAIRTRQRAAAVVRRADCQVLLHRLKGDTFWALPGGAIEPGESALDAIARELHEELDTAVALGNLAFVVENFFRHADDSHHEIGLYLHATPLPGSLLAASDGPYEGMEGEQTLIFAWFPPHELAALDLRPAFLRTALAQAASSAGALHIVHRDAPQSPLAARGIVDTPVSFS